MSETAKKIINNLAYFLGGDLLAKLIGFTSIVVLARKLGAGDFGKLGFAEAFYGYFIYVGVAGIDTIATRDIARDRTRAGEYLGNVLSLKLILSAGGFVLLSLLAFSLGISPELRALSVLYGLCLLPIALSPEWMFQGIERMRLIGVFRVLREAVYLSGILLIVSYPSGFYAVPVVRAGAMLMAVVFLLLAAWKMGFKPRLRRSRGLWAGLLRESYPILASQLLIIVIYNFSIVLMGVLGRPEDVGHYSAAQKIILFFIGLSGVFWAVLFPRIAGLYIESKDALRAFEEKVSKVICAVAVPVGVLGYAMAPEAIRFFYGDGYQRSAEVFRVLIWVAMLAFVTGIFAQGLLATGKQKYFFKTVAVQAAINVSLVFLLVPRHGVIGAAAAWLSAEAAGFFIYKKFYNSEIKFGFYRYLLRPLIASMAAVFAVEYLGGVNLVIALSGGAATYLLTMLCVRGIEVRELKVVYQGLLKI